MSTPPTHASTVLLALAGMASASLAQSDPALFNTVITLPDDAPTITGRIESSTQLNLYPGGEISGTLGIGERFAPYTYNEANIYGGFAGLLQPKPGCRVNVFGGVVYNIEGDESVLTCSDGWLGYLSNSGPTTLTGGLLGKINCHSETPLTIEGAEFELNGEPVSALSQPLDDDDVFTGVFADGTVFMFSPMREDRLGGANTTLVPVPVPPLDLAPVVIESGVGPRGLRPGQSLTVRGPATLPVYFVAHQADVVLENTAPFNDETASFSLVNLLQIHEGTLHATDSELPFPVYTYGGQITLVNSTGYRLYAFKGSQVEIHGSSGTSATIDSQSSLRFTDGFLGPYSKITGQSTFEMTGGSIDRDFRVEQGSTADISGGQIGDNFDANDSTINVSGGTIGSRFSPDGSNITLTAGQIGGSCSPRGGSFVMTGGVLGSFCNFGSIYDVSISGGQIGDDLRFRGGDIRISGGQFGYAFSMAGSARTTISGGSFGIWFQLEQSASLNLVGTEFQIDGVPIDGLAENVETVLAQRDVTLTGVFEDGTPFSFDLNSTETTGEDFFSPTATLSVTLVRPPCPADTNGDGILDLGDIQVFVQLFLSSDLAADINNDSVLDLGDIQLFVAAFLAGC